MANDSLAQGARSVSYGNSGVKVTQDQWESIFGKPEVGIHAEKAKKPSKKKFRAKKA